ncbi:MAG: hypothetical protein DWQ06_07085 [Calditrichaeota bacterium]|nr:MAG: hypothetical protein DWQ06_07085 [Calditrichota bacterium]
MKKYTDCSIKAATSEQRIGKIFGNKIFLPFLADFISITEETTGFYTGGNNKVLDFSSAGEIEIDEKKYFTSIYFKKEKDLQEEYGEGKGNLILVCCEKDGNVFDEKTYITLELSMSEGSDEIRIKKVEN